MLCPSPTIPPPPRPIQSPSFCSASERDAQQKGKATSTGQHRDQYW
ncbi:hypothetical protein HMPREF3185_01350 [Porphyromonas somerae]|uniref:Uncharacterized protein n=1 Tax=Porphyromonas somerae TaxID=322095 RepID=A0A134B6D2_9PORP|nr:hypothetical protein HMPREF3184_01350 [Porphyromonadaceae bacterium KA00676]KXB75502.1 hypothetical protein HMPREF3185_01350 [Porphyromonas somerae]